MNDPAEWEAIHKSRMWGTYPDIHVVRQVKRFMSEWRRRMSLVPRPLTPDALDIGCGTGANTGMMCDEGMRVCAFDSSDTALGYMCERLGDKQFFAAKSTVQDFMPPHRFDFILDNFTLTNIEHPPWDRILSWLKPGGWLVHASFFVGPMGSPQTWYHTSPGGEVESHEISNDHGRHAFTVRRYIKPS